MNDQEIEQELIRLFGMDGTGDTSEDDQEESDFDENHEEQVLFQDSHNQQHEDLEDAPPAQNNECLDSNQNDECSDNNQNDELSDDDGTDVDEPIWKKKSWVQNPDISSFDKPMKTTLNIPPRSRPQVYFEYFFNDDVMMNLVTQTNLFASQKQDRNWVPVTNEELKVYIGMLIQMAVHIVPSVEDYWSSDPLLAVPEIANTMTSKRFLKISQNIHINDNSKMPKKGEEGYDKLYKIRPLLDHLNKACQENATMSGSQSIDESMIKFKGRSSLKQYMPLKPIKRGFKMWVRADSHTGYVYEYELYTGKGESVEMGLGGSIVKRLCKKVIESSAYQTHVSFDNFFTSIELLQYLYDHGVYSTGTVRNDRLGLPILVKPLPKTGNKVQDAENIVKYKKQVEKVKKMVKGDAKWRTNKNVGFVLWKDTKMVSMMTTAFHPRKLVQCKRTQKNGSKKDVNCPMCVFQYNKRMGGVDRFDRKKVTFGINRRSKKWWKRIMYYLIDLAICNAHILYNSNNRQHNRMTLKQFRIALSRNLINNTTYRKRPFSSEPKFKAIKRSSVDDLSRQKSIFTVPEEIRLGNRGVHFPEEISTYKRCRQCSSKTNNKRSKIQCDTCLVALCAVPCFKLFHFEQM